MADFHKAVRFFFVALSASERQFFWERGRQIRFLVPAGEGRMREVRSP